ncbi:MAG: restriction endonuclease subunit S [Lachnospiraceae bacterium]|nr:restriction endonuclease subunit S [Lachnospiraceae bacterium]
MSKLEELIQELCPDGVEYRNIGDIATCFPGATPKTSIPEYWENGTIPWMSSGEVNYREVTFTEKKITQLGYDNTSTKMVPVNSVVIALAGQGKTRGTVAITRIPLCTNQSLCAIIPKSNIISEFLLHFLRSQYQQLRDVSSGDGTRGGLNLKMINAYKIPVPPRPIQEEIVRILDNFTELTAELTARKIQYEYYRNELLKFDEKVKMIKLGDFATISRGGNFQKKDFCENGVPCIHYGQIYTRYGLYTKNTIAEITREAAEKSKFATKNDVIMAVTSENIEDVCKCVAWLGDKDIAVSGHTAIIHHNQNPKYLSYYFHTNMFFNQKRKLAHGTKVIEVTPSKLADIEIPIPTIEEQNRIVNILDRFDYLCNDISKGLPAEIEARQKQYEYYRDKLLSFKRMEA